MKHTAASGLAAYSHAADGDCGTGALCEGGRAFCWTGRCSDVVDRHIDLKGRRSQVRETNYSSRFSYQKWIRGLMVSVCSGVGLSQLEVI